MEGVDELDGQTNLAIEQHSRLLEGSVIDLDAEVDERNKNEGD